MISFCFFITSIAIRPGLSSPIIPCQIAFSTYGCIKNAGIKQVEVGPGPDGYYGKFLEFGTVKMKANPFMSRGYETSKSESIRIIEEEIRKGLGL